MSRWIPSDFATPSLPGWYPVLSNWQTGTRHESARRWLGTKWRSTCPERIEFFAPERFDDPHQAASRAYEIPEASSDRSEDVSVAAPLAVAAG